MPPGLVARYSSGLPSTSTRPGYGERARTLVDDDVPDLKAVSAKRLQLSDTGGGGCLREASGLQIATDSPSAASKQSPTIHGFTPSTKRCGIGGGNGTTRSSSNPLSAIQRLHIGIGVHAAVGRGQHHVEAEHRREGRLGAAFVGEHVAHHEQAAGHRGRPRRVAIRPRQACSVSRWNMPDISTTSLPEPKVGAVVVAVAQDNAVARPGGRDEFARNGRDARQLEHLGDRRPGKRSVRSTEYVPGPPPTSSIGVAALQIEDADQRARDAERALVHRLHESARASRVVAEVGLGRERGLAGAQARPRGCPTSHRAGRCSGWRCP